MVYCSAIKEWNDTYNNVDEFQNILASEKSWAIIYFNLFQNSIKCQ